MKQNKKIIALSLCLASLVLSSPNAAPFAPDTTRRNVWVFFRDKGDGGGPPALAKRQVSALAKARRDKAGFRDTEGDRPVSGGYIREVERLGGALRTVFPWRNAASFSVSPSGLPEISSLSFVKSISPVGVYTRKKVGDAGGGSGGLPKSKAAASKSAALPGGYGYDWHIEMVGIPLAHDYLRYKGLDAPGSGVVMAFFDGGFRLDHAVYKRLRDKSQVLAAYDFVDGDSTVADPDSVTNNPRHPYYKNDRHGSQTLSLAAGYDVDTAVVFIGAAFGANFALARTEDDGDSTESRVEEDNWAAAVEWAEKLGAQIISSSLGYRDGHTDTAQDWSYGDMNGETTIVSFAAAEALKRGMIVVNSMGNEGSNASGTLVAPADVDGVVSVGAVSKNRVLAPFSSTGPTSDGRMKPEVVAPGLAVPAPEPYSIDRASYTLVDGTSFSAPIVSAIMALILQAHPDILPDSARKRLYASCSFALGQTVADNKFGYGVPNAALAVIGEDEIFLKITDTAKAPLAGAVAEFEGQTYTADSVGNILIKTRNPALPARLVASYRGGQPPDTITVNALPFAQVVELGGKWNSGLKVAPNIIRNDGVVKGRYTITGANPSTPIVVTVRTLMGKKVWTQKLRPRPDGTADFEWNVKTANKRGGAAAGVYIVVVQYGHGMICKRVVVSH